MAANPLQNYLDWLYLPIGKTDLIRRLTGLMSIPMLAIVWTWHKGGPGPFNVPAWRIGGVFLEPPNPPILLTNMAFLAACIASLFLLLGFKQKWLTLVLFLTFAYFAPRDLMCSSPHYIVLTTSFLFALLLDRPGRSPTRRMIQLSVFSCYFLSAVNKIINPAWTSGESLHSIMFEVAQKSPQYAGMLDLPLWFWCLSSWLVAVWEAAMPFGLLSDKFRKISIITGFAFHALICIIIEPLLLMFATTMWVGWLAYLPGKVKPKTTVQGTLNTSSSRSDQPEVSSLTEPAASTPTEPASSSSTAPATSGSKEAATQSPAKSESDSAGIESPPPSTPTVDNESLPTPDLVPSKIRFNAILATLYIVFIFAVPLRTFFWSGRTVQLMTGFDRMPWSFHMFDIGSDKPEAISAKWKDSKDVWHDVPIEGRLKRLSSDNEMYALVNHTFVDHPEAKEVSVELTNRIREGQLMQHKSVTASAPTFVLEPVVVIENKTNLK